MRLFINDKFFESFIKLPQGIQKKVLDFQKKFREDSKLRSIHLEPISTFKDPKLRTARIDKKYRAIISTSSSGNDFYMLRVDNHDEAMKWAENKIFEWNENTQVAQLFTMPDIDMVEQQKIDKEPEIGLFSIYTDDQLLDVGVPEKLLKAVKNISDWDQLEALEEILPRDAFENLFDIADGANIEQLIFDIQEGQSKDAIKDQFSSINNRRTFIEVDDELMEKMISGDIEKWQIFLHPEQRKLVEGRYKGPMKVTGGAGTGKTIAAIHRLKSLVEYYKSEKKPVLFCTFTKSLAKNLSKSINKLEIKQDAFKLTTIDSFLIELGKKHKIIDSNTRILDYISSRSSIDFWNEILEQNLSEFDAEFLNDEYESVILQNNVSDIKQYLNQTRIGRGKPITRKQRVDIWELFEKYKDKQIEGKIIGRFDLYNLVSNYLQENNIHEYSHAIVDEVQDLSNVELRFIRSLVPEGPDDLFLVGDPFQSIYNRSIHFSNSGINIRGKRSKKLKINYRTTEEIKRLAMSMVEGVRYEDFDGEEEKLNGYVSLIHGEKPTYQLFDTKDKEINQIVTEIIALQQSGFNLNDIVISCRLRDSLKELKSALHNQDFPYYDVTSQSGSTNGVNLSTFHNMKGLEYKIVLLSDVNNRTAPLKPTDFDNWDNERQQRHLTSEKSLLYVAISRGMIKTEVFGTGIKSELIDI